MDQQTKGQPIGQVHDAPSNRQSESSAIDGTEKNGKVVNAFDARGSKGPKGNEQASGNQSGNMTTGGQSQDKQPRSNADERRHSSGATDRNKKHK